DPGPGGRGNGARHRPLRPQIPLPPFTVPCAVEFETKLNTVSRKFTMSDLRFGCFSRISAAAPATIGAANDVPSPRSVPAAVGHSRAKPGASRAGLSIPGVWVRYA